jgi:hypothetical protein
MIGTSFGMPISALATAFLGQTAQTHPYIAPVYRADIVHTDLRVYNFRVYEPIEIYKPPTPNSSWSLAATAESPSRPYAAAPFMQFKARGKAGDKVTVTWLDTRGEKRTDEAAVT